MSRAVGPELREFLYAHFESADALEAVLIIHRRKGGWTPARLAKELDVGEDRAMDILVSLHWMGLLSHGKDGDYRFEPRTAELRARIEELSRYPLSRLLAEIEVILAPRSFADAFRFRKDRKDG